MCHYCKDTAFSAVVRRSWMFHVKNIEVESGGRLFSLAFRCEAIADGSCLLSITRKHFCRLIKNV